MGWGDRVRRAFGLSAREVLGTAEMAIPQRIGRSTTGAVRVDPESALRHSAVWACQRLRADLLSTMPRDCFRNMGGIQVEMPLTSFLQSPDGGSWVDWAFATQWDLDRFGNTVGLITAVDGFGFPAVVELVPMDLVGIKLKGRRITGYRIDGQVYDPAQVWHERQYTIAGVPLGLSPLAYAMWSIGAYLSAQRFALDYFGSGGMPSGVLRNTERQITDPVFTDEVKRQFKASTQDRDIFVTGRDWEWTPAQAEAVTGAYLEELRWGVTDVCRFMGVPADLIDGSIPGQSVTYANIGQRNLQLLIMNLGPTVIRREAAFTRAVWGDRFVKLNTDALLRMDPETRQRTMLAQVAGRTLAPSEARALDNRSPFTPEQIAEIQALLPSKVVQPKVDVIA